MVKIISKKNEGKVHRIEYVDAHYYYRERLGQTKLAPHSAYGYVKENNGNIIITFIRKERGSNYQINKKDSLVKGLIIPNTALISVVQKYKTDILEDVGLGKKIEITWRDVIFVANNPVYACPVMLTKGILHKIEKDHIVITKPKTIRKYPAPNINHPVKSPAFYVIPISFIIEIRSTE